MIDISRQEQFDRAYLGMAREVAALSRCNRRQVGAVIVSDRDIVSFGFNGTPPGFDNTCETADGLATKSNVLHAERNAILKCAQSNKSTQNATLYCTDSPCYSCALEILGCGISRVVYHNIYWSTDGIDLLREAEVSVEIIIKNN
jgi:dCMP deaminase